MSVRRPARTCVLPVPRGPDRPKLAASKDQRNGGTNDIMPDNAFIEAFNARFRSECLNTHWFMTLADAAEKMEAWVKHYNRASEHPSGYVIEVKRFCCAGGDPVGYLGFCRARAVMDWAASVARVVRAKIQGPSGRGWIASISPASTASLSVLVETLRSLAASVRLSQGSTPSAAGLNTGSR